MPMPIRIGTATADRRSRSVPECWAIRARTTGSRSAERGQARDAELQLNQEIQSDLCDSSLCNGSKSASCDR